MTETKITYGVQISRHESHGSQRVVVRVMKRESDEMGVEARHPINACDRFGDPGPCYVEDLCIEGWVSDCRNTDGSYPFCGFYPAFYHPYSVALGKAKKMVKTLSRIESRIARDEASDVGDVFMAFCKAIGATWACVETCNRGTMLSDSEWEFMSLAKGRDVLRLRIIEAQRLTAERKAA